MSKSKIYKEITKDDICKIAMDLYGNDTKVIHYNVLKGGLFNTTYFIKTNKEKSGIVLRVAPINTHLLFEFEKDMMAEEPLFHKLLEDNGIPTSKVLKYSPHGKVIDREYIISEYINSIPMNDPLLKDHNLKDVYEEVGNLTKLIHKITNDKFGWKRKNGWGEYEKWSQFVLSFVKEISDKSEQYNLFNPSDIKKFSDIFNDNISALDEITTPYMTHTDLWQGNVLVNYKNDKYNVAAIIDLDRIIFGDKYWDLANPWLINDSFIKGYGEKIPNSINHNKRCLLYKLIGTFFETYVSLVQYDNAEWSNNAKNDSLLLLNKF